MSNHHPYNLTVADAATHYALSPRTVRSWIRDGTLQGARVGGVWRCRWKDLWALEQGPAPRGVREADYRRPLLTKAQAGALWGVSTRTVERWIASGLPTRSVNGNVRVAPAELEAWTTARFGLGSRP